MGKGEGQETENERNGRRMMMLKKRRKILKSARGGEEEEAEEKEKSTEEEAKSDAFNLIERVDGAKQVARVELAGRPGHVLPVEGRAEGDEEVGGVKGMVSAGEVVDVEGRRLDHLPARALRRRSHFEGGHGQATIQRRVGRPVLEDPRGRVFEAAIA